MIVTVSMALTPLVLKFVTLSTSTDQPSGKELDELALPAGPAIDESSPAIVIAGFGRVGQILGRILTAQGIAYTAIDTNPEQVKLVRQFGNKVYYGDLLHLSLLESAHVEEAKILALCIDDVEKSIQITRQLKRRYPNLRIMARARNRHHEIRLRNLEVDFVIRDTLLSSLEISRSVLLALGCEPEEANSMIATFSQLDNKLIEQQAALVDDHESMIQTAQDAATEFRRLLQSESEAAGESPGSHINQPGHE
jgi:voltage-gated potassium channel Kch